MSDERDLLTNRRAKMEKWLDLEGSFLYAIVSRGFRLEWFTSLADFVRHMIGAVLMGIGGAGGLSQPTVDTNVSPPSSLSPSPPPGQARSGPSRSHPP